MLKKISTLLSVLFLGIATVSSQSSLNSLDFDGVNDYVTSPLPSVFNSIQGANFTIEAWIKPNGFTFSRIVYAQQSSTNFATLSLGNGNQIYFYVSNITSAMTSSTLPVGGWSHVACTWDASTSVIEIFINGILQTTTNGGSSSTGVSNVMTIGSRTDGAQFFQGEIDELRIWNVKRTPCEIYAAKNAEFTISNPNLVTYYKFNQGIAGATNTGSSLLTDFTSNYNGTLNNFALTGTNSNWLNSGAGISSVNQFNGILTATDVRTECGSYTWINGITYFTDTTTTYLFPGSTLNGCDSLITLDLTILNPVNGTDIRTACNEFTWVDGNLYTASNNSATYTYPGGATNGCDSTVTLNLTIYQPSFGVDNIIACNAHTWIDGITYTSNNSNANYTIIGGAASGCDSIVTLNLLINSVSELNTITSGTSITASNQNASYQWLDCNNGYATILGANQQTFTATINGNYAVQLTENGCVDTSTCVAISGVGIVENTFQSFINAYPNPTTGEFFIDLGEINKRIQVSITDVSGRLIFTESYTNSQLLNLSLDEPAGLYIVLISSAENKATIRYVKE